MLPSSLILKMKLVPLSLPRPSYVSPSFGLYCSACFGSLCPSFVHVVATFPDTVLFPLLCSVLQFFCLIHWFFSLSSFVIPSRCLKNVVSCNVVKTVGVIFYICHLVSPVSRFLVLNQSSKNPCVWRLSAVYFQQFSNFKLLCHKN